MKRRPFLAGVGATAVTALAGCSRIIEGLVDLALEDVNVSSDAEEPVTIRVEIADSAGATVFEETVSLPGTADVPDDEEDEATTEQFSDVWESTDEYTVSAEVEDGPSKTETVTIEATDDSLLVVYEEDEIEIGRFSELFDDEDA